MKKSKADQETIVSEEKASTAPVQAESSADDFFSAKEANADMKLFINQMKKPREKIEAPPIMQSMEEKEAEAESLESEANPEAGESDEDMLSHFDYTEEHRLTAEFILVQLDKFLAFSCSLVSGMESDRYRRRKNKIEGEDYEAEILAALVKKYQMRLSLEWMFASAMVMGYAPVVNKAVKDRKLKKQKTNES